jgi:hypothetical protein
VPVGSRMFAACEYYACTCVYTCMCVCVCIYMCMYVCMYVCINMCVTFSCGHVKETHARCMEVYPCIPVPCTIAVYSTLLSFVYLVDNTCNLSWYVNRSGPSRGRQAGRRAGRQAGRQVKATLTVRQAGRQAG